MSPPMVKRKYRHPWLCVRVHGGVVPEGDFEDRVGQEKLCDLPDTVEFLTKRGGGRG